MSGWNIVAIGAFSIILGVIYSTILYAVIVERSLRSSVGAAVTLGVSAGIFLAFRYIAPWYFNVIVFQGLILHAFIALPVVVGFFLFVFGFKIATGQGSLIAAISSLSKPPHSRRRGRHKKFRVVHVDDDGKQKVVHEGVDVPGETVDSDEGSAVALDPKKKPLLLAGEEDPTPTPSVEQPTGDPTSSPEMEESEDVSVSDDYPPLDEADDYPEQDDNPPAVVLPSTGVMYCIFAVIIALGGSIGVNTVNHWYIASEYPFPARDARVEVHQKILRYTPQEVAYRQMKNQFGAAEFEIDLEHTYAMDLDGGFGYVATIMPKGMVNVFSSRVDGFLVYDDNPGVPQDERMYRVSQPFAVGPGMYIFDNLDRVLATHNPWRTYGRACPLQLNPNDKKDFTLVVPVMAYRYRFPFFWIPYQWGVTLVKSDGSLEDLSMEDLATDARFTSRHRRVMSADFFRTIVEYQIYDEGFIRGWYQRPGLIQIPTLPGRVQMPFLQTAKDGSEYFAILAEPNGGKATSRIYYMNASTGERSKYECGDKGLIGPENGAEYVRSLGTFRWVDAKGDGDFHVIEPRLLTRDDRLYEMYSITTKNHAEIALTGVVDMHSQKLLTFANRESLELWAQGHEVPAQADTLREEVKSVRVLLENAAKKLRELEAQPPK